MRQRPDSKSVSATPRLWHRDRHRQLLEVAELLLSSGGPDALVMDDLARAAGVTRPICYKHFRNRQDLLIQLVRAYGGDLQAILVDAVRRHPDSLERCLRLALAGLCQAIEQRGAGSWKLLAAGGPDPEVNVVVEALRDEMMRPWVPRIRQVTGGSAKEAEILCHLTLASVRTVIDLWIAGRVPRLKAERIILRSLTALLREFHRR